MRERVRLGFVVPRYGAEIVGGAETLARSFAEHLPADRFEVEVLTTCAVDHYTWRNVLPKGVERRAALTIRRFPVSGRDVERFVAVQSSISDGLPVELEDELVWAAESVNSDELYAHLESEAASFDALLFLPYLFGTTLVGTQVAPERSILIPCLHDEGFAYTRVVRNAFRAVRGVLFNSAAERGLAQRLFDVAEDSPVVGLGFDLPRTATDGGSGLRRRYGIDGDYLLYFGRKEGGKNLPLLLECFAACGGAGEGLSLVVAGDGSIDPAIKPEGVIDLPRLDEEEKRAACAGALALCQPSTNESFSIVLMEAWLESTPVLVNARCPVTREHVSQSNGGLYFEDATDFAAEVDWLRGHREEAAEMGENGRAFVADRYSWPAVLRRFDDGLRQWGVV